MVKFWTLLKDYGKDSVERLEEREKQLAEMQRRQQVELLRSEDIASKNMTKNLLNHMHSFYGSKQTTEKKADRISRMRRAKSMPKIDDEVSRMYKDAIFCFQNEATLKGPSFNLTHSILTAKQFLFHLFTNFQIHFQFVRPKHDYYVKFTSCSA